MSPIKILAVILIIAGVLGLAYGTFTYTKETHTANVGPLTLSVKDKETVDIPLWASVGAVVAGVVLLVVGRSK
jgi:multidrug transporter EmrE-like cation transporter